MDQRAPRSLSKDEVWPNWYPTTEGDHLRTDTGNLPDQAGLVICDRCHATRWARHTPAVTAADRLALADRLRHDSPAFVWVGTNRRVRWLLRDFLGAGWTAEDVLHALDTHPADGPYAFATSAPGTRGGIRNPAGWVLHRLKAWRGLDGNPVAPFSATHAAALTARRVADAAQAAADRRAAATATEPSAVYRTARSGLRRTSGRPPPGPR